MNGYAGKILRLDLTQRTYQLIDTENYAKWFGGHGIGSAIFFDIVVKEKRIDLSSIDGFSKENVVTLMAPPLCGTGVPGGSGRTEVQAIGVHSSPIGWFTRSDVGGRFAAMLKFAGWDGIVLEGAADMPVWLDIRDEQVIIRDCEELGLWGTDTETCQQKIWDFVLEGGEAKNWHRPTGLKAGTTQLPAVLAIGAAGENLCRIASIMHDSGHASGEGGFGAVWGSKKLKAISVLGSGGIHVANPAALFQARQYQKAHYQFNLSSEVLKEEKGSYPSDGQWVPPITGAIWSVPVENEGSRPSACVGCHSGCRARYRSGRANEAKCYTSYFYKYYRNEGTSPISPEQYADIERRATVLANLLGINVHELMYGIPYLKYLNKQGLFGPGKPIECPLDFSTLGTYEFIEQLLKAIAYGNDGKGNPSSFGEAMKEGFYRAAKRWGRCEGQGTDNDLISGMLPFPHWGLPLHLDPRFQIEWGYSNILSDRDVCEHDFDFLHKNPTEDAKTLVTAEEGVRIYTDKMVPYHQDTDRMRMLDYSDGNMYSDYIVKLVAWFRHYTRFYKRAMGFCDWQWPDFVNPYGPGKVGSTGEAEPKFINAVMGTERMGRELTFADGIEMGRKIWNLDRAIWILQGRDRTMEKFADYIYKNVVNGQPGTAGRHLVPCYANGQWEYKNVNSETRKIDEVKFEAFKTRFYQFEGWDPETGWPTRKTLQDLGMTDVAEELKMRGKLGEDAS